MDYHSCLDWLFNKFANYQKFGGKNYKPGLDTILNILSEIDNPHKKIKTIHIAGTNGKGSTAHILASVLIENGYKVGLFTSPHIKDFRERIKINGKLTSKESIVDFINSNQLVIEKYNPSFFEITTAMAFSIFEKEKCDISIIETGLGGRLDATNVINPEISIITNIDLDHTEFLGNTLKEIANEKAGIIKHKIPVVIGEKLDETAVVFQNKANHMQSQIYFVSLTNKIYETDLLGKFQSKNIDTALFSIKILQQNGWYIDDEKIKQALKNIYRNTSFMGRFYKIHSNDYNIIADACHNYHGFINLLDEISRLKFKNLICVYGSSKDKEYEKIISSFPNNHTYIFTEFDSERTVRHETFDLLGKKHNLNFHTFNNTVLALTKAKELYSEGDLILIFGSFYLLEKII